MRQVDQERLTELPLSGDVFVFDVSDDMALEWLVVRNHPDDNSLLLLAPVDDFPLVGASDVVLARKGGGALRTVRCGQTDWFPASLCVPRLRCGVLTERQVGLVRQRLADLARGILLPSSGDNFDPEYEEWIIDISRARLQLLNNFSNS